MTSYFALEPALYQASIDFLKDCVCIYGGSTWLWTPLIDFKACVCIDLFLNSICRFQHYVCFILWNDLELKKKTRGFIFLNSVYKFLLVYWFIFNFYPSHTIWASGGTRNPFPSFKYAPSWFYDMHLWSIKWKIIVYMIIYYKTSTLGEGET